MDTEDGVQEIDVPVLQLERAQHTRTRKDDVAICQWARRQNRPHLILQRRGTGTAGALVRARLVAATGWPYWQGRC